jgi:hypothetical protein
MLLDGRLIAPYHPEKIIPIATSIVFINIYNIEAINNSTTP